MFRSNISKKAYSTIFNMVEGKPANKIHRMVPQYEGKFEPKQNNIDFESGKEVLMDADEKTFGKRRFDRIYNAIETMTYRKYEDIPENKEIFIYGFQHIKTDKVDNYILIACELDESFENDKLFNIWSIRFIIKEIEKRDFKITGWPFMTLVKRNIF